MDVNEEQWREHLTKLALERGMRIVELELFIESHGLEVPR